MADRRRALLLFLALTLPLFVSQWFAFAFVISLLFEQRCANQPSVDSSKPAINRQFKTRHF